ncbi:hypothetical protein EVAR_103208_1 [Eumeta japonica]|uniref:Uncharacterized protein n=1 Tax=Eumeta variegata TaxID=151549 RepID=A0A4C2A2Q3_EUMVA|nr:hypothetical protein EVAR_103208_1 [Eumeta japonica]
MRAYNLNKFGGRCGISAAACAAITPRKNAERPASATLRLNVATIYIMARYLDRDWEKYGDNNRGIYLCSETKAASALAVNIKGGRRPPPTDDSLFKGKRVREPSKSRWSPPSIDACNTRGVNKAAHSKKSHYNITNEPRKTYYVHPFSYYSLKIRYTAKSRPRPSRVNISSYKTSVFLRSNIFAVTGLQAQASYLRCTPTPAVIGPWPAASGPCQFTSVVPTRRVNLGSYAGSTRPRRRTPPRAVSRVDRAVQSLRRCL